MHRSFEKLENRQLFAGGAFYQPLVIDGTEQHDMIVVEQDGAFVNVTINGKPDKYRWQSVAVPGGSTPNSPPTWLPGISKIVLSGKGGDDVLDASKSPVKMEIYGGAGRDTITGSAKDDMILGPDKRPTNGSMASPSETYLDVIDGMGGNDLIHAAERGGSTLNGGAGNDTIWGSIYNDVIDAGIGNDNVNPGKGHDRVTLGPDVSANLLALDNDSVDAREGNDTVHGGLGNDMIIAGVGHDELWGGTGNDTFACDAGNDTIRGEGGNDKIYAGEGNDVAYGGDGHDTLQGHAGNDSLFGGKGNDIVQGGVGTDYMTGDADFDEVSYVDHFQPVTVALNSSANNGQPAENDFVGQSFEVLRGGGGNDTLTGNAGVNVIFGETGDDLIRAGAGHDVVDGGYGKDRVWGQDDNDKIDGSYGDDELFAGKGEDTVVGGAGQDRIVTVGGNKDSVEGNGGNDVFVVGNEDTVKDYKDTNVEKDALHKIGSFANGASLEVDGQNLADPSLSGFAAHYDKRFNNVPLFHQGGPNGNDIVQGSIGDCYFVAGLSAMARSPRGQEIIKRNIVDLGDGSYMVKFFDDATPKWYRVDNQLPIKDKTFDEIAFAKTRGGDNAAMWVPIMEKAWACHRTGEARYEEIVGDNDWADPGMPYEAYGAFGLWHDTDEVIFNDLDDYMQKMRNFLVTGGAVTASTDPPWLGCDITAFHVYTVENVSADLKWVTIRNPWATDDAAFATGPNDGRIVVSAEQFDDDFFFVSYSNL